MKRTLSLWGLVAFLCAGAVFAQAPDFGLVLNQLPVLTNGDKSYGDFSYTGTVMPWLAAPLGERGDLYLSGGVTAELADEAWKLVPEVFRLEFMYGTPSGLRFEVGRFSWQDPAQFALAGLFDGLALSADIGKARLSAGVFYTGLLNKRNAYIVMGGDDLADYNDREVYFASRRLVFSLGWEIPALFNTAGDLALSVFGQIDLNNNDTAVHSQYGEVRLGVPFLTNFSADFGAVLGVTEEQGEPGIGFAFRSDLVWLLPSAVDDRLSLGGAFASGAWTDKATAFIPINTIAQGKVLRPRLSGLALIQGEYVVRLHRTFSLDVSAAYFFRTDTVSYDDPDLDSDSGSPLLGGEVYGGLTWAPVSDVSFLLGGGAFFPTWGKAFSTDAELKYRVSLGLILSF